MCVCVGGALGRGWMLICHLNDWRQVAHDNGMRRGRQKSYGPERQGNVSWLVVYMRVCVSAKICGDLNQFIRFKVVWFIWEHFSKNSKHSKLEATKKDSLLNLSRLVSRKLVNLRVFIPWFKTIFGSFNKIELLIYIVQWFSFCFRLPIVFHISWKNIRSWIFKNRLSWSMYTKNMRLENWLCWTIIKLIQCLQLQYKKRLHIASYQDVPSQAVWHCEMNGMWGDVVHQTLVKCKCKNTSQ